jgi:hypothetical protein
MSLRTISVLGALSVLGGIVQIAGCATTDDTTIVVTPDADGLPPVIDSGKPPVKDATVDAKPPVKDTGTADVVVTVIDASADSAPKDAAPDTGTSAPATGTPCTVVGTNYTQSCGICGKREALCEVDLKVGLYSPCAGEVVGGCMPGTTTSKSCGICGTQTVICDNMCSPSTGACTGELAGGCVPGTVKTTVAGCTVLGEVRTQTCSATCMLGAPTACAQPVYPTLTISRTLAGTVSGDFTLSPLTDQIGHITSGTCPATISSTATSYSWVKLVNPGATPATVTVWGSDAVGGTPDLDTVAAWYLSATKPDTDALRKACNGYASDTCTTAPCVGGYAGFVKTSSRDERVIVPANSFVFIYTAEYDRVDTGLYKLSARTDAL